MSVVCTANGRRIFYDVVGDGPPLLAIAGLTGSRKALLASLDDSLISRHQIVAIENRDAGESDPETAYYTMAEMADDAVALLDALGIARAHVLGFSMGATIALQLALDAPHRLNRLVLVSGHAFNALDHQAGEPLPAPPAWWSDDPVERWRRLMPEVVGPDYRGRLTASALTLHAEADRGNRATWPGAMRQVATRSGLDMRDRLVEVKAPTLVVHGEQDTVVPREHGKVLAAGIPGARLRMLPRVGHLPLTEEPQETARAILEFLEETE